MKQPADELEAMIGYRLKQAQAALRSRMDETLKQLELTTSQYSCLETIGRRPGASNAEIARSVFVSRQAMNTLLRGLQQRGLVTRAERAEAGRALPIRLTGEGRRLLGEAAARIARIEKAMSDALGPERRTSLMSGLTRCVDALEDLPDPE
ncbi:MarR family winged helix-turn-helix transcriptional regulator [Rothia halotolerans]|uniref:MarR family winged helix-turn-helix transcriptional regulator n=1 Tax=Rothia halotolerans TaxID=405770 RepID=UPI00101C434B|nr:MarR family transcriptional regulator [Rothia halotolerans]